MAGHVSQLATPNRRLGSLIAPREHGAWGLLLVPLATGGAVGVLAGGNALPLASLTIAALVLFWLRTPIESWLGIGLIRARTHQERRVVAITILLLAKIAVAALISLFWMGRNFGLLYFGLAAIAAFTAQSFVRKLGRRGRMPAQIVGTLGLTVGAHAAYYVATGQFNRIGWALWTANFLFAGNQIHFVQLRIRSARLGNWREKFLRGYKFLIGQLVLAMALAFFWHSHLLPALAALAFVPILVRGVAWFFEGPKPLVVRAVGWTELAHAVIFGLLFVAGFALSSNASLR